ncbi:transglycosylase SLT domain-containing protein [Xylophilus sp. Kf1]|nr:transglycosylase SLT domain-containing protein [Xylophilus sp. Kf1]
MSVFTPVPLIRRLAHIACLGAALGGVPAWAQSDVWGWVDDHGTAHMAGSRIDPRYQLLFRAGQSFDSRDMGNAGSGTAHGVAVAPERLRTLVEISPGMKAVARQLREASLAAGLDFELLQALIAAESGFNAGAVSPRGAVGLMQLMPATARQYGVVADARREVADKLVDPATNIRAGTRYLRYLVDLFPGRLELALAAYNAGEGAVQRAGNRIPNYPETQNYVKTVMQLYQSLKPGGNLRAAPVRVRMEIPVLLPDTTSGAFEAPSSSSAPVANQPIR